MYAGDYPHSVSFESHFALLQHPAHLHGQRPPGVRLRCCREAEGPQQTRRQRTQGEGLDKKKAFLLI